MLLGAPDHAHEGFLLDKLTCKIQIQRVLLIQGFTLCWSVANLLRDLQAAACISLQVEARLRSFTMSVQTYLEPVLSVLLESVKESGHLVAAPT